MKTRGFTLIEIMVAVSIIAILTAVIGVRTVTVGQQSRDADRQTDLRTVQAALELYKSKYGRYPAGCNGPGVWSGQVGSGYACSGGNPLYIVGYEADKPFTPEFMQALPKDPKLNGTNSGYVYATNAEGSVFKFMALDTVESETVGYQHHFARCGNMDSGLNDCSSVRADGSGTGAYNTGGSEPSQCAAGPTSNDYAVVGGYAAGGMVGGTYRTSDAAREYFTDLIRCR